MEHHLFPAVCFVHYPAIAAIVKDECGKQGVPYATYPSLPTILGRFIAFMAKAGAAEQRPMARAERFWVFSPCFVFCGQCVRGVGGLERTSLSLSAPCPQFRRADIGPVLDGGRSAGRFTPMPGQEGGCPLSFGAASAR